MNEKTTELLTALAIKFGTTVDHLWGVLVKQSVIHGVTGFVIWAAIAIMVGFGVRFVIDNTTGPDPEWDDDIGVPFAWTCSFVAVLLVTAFGIADISDFITAILNPEFMALRWVLKP